MRNKPKEKTKYDRVAVTLHWVMALAFFAMLGSGLSFDNIPMSQSFKFNMYQWHKSLGVILLIAFFIRIGWRLFHYPPKLPDKLSKLDKIGSKFGHWALYGAMIIMPLSGWAMVSSSSYGLPTIVFEWFTWPHIPDIAGNKMINGLAKDTHEIVAWIFIALIIVHVGAVIKHAKFDHINLLKRMSFKKATRDD